MGAAARFHAMRRHETTLPTNLISSAHRCVSPRSGGYPRKCGVPGFFKSLVNLHLTFYHFINTDLEALKNDDFRFIESAS